MSLIFIRLLQHLWIFLISEPFARHFSRGNLSSSHRASDSNTIATSETKKSSQWRNFMSKPLFLVHFFLGFGLLAIAFKQLRRKNAHPSQSPELIAKNWEVMLITYMLENLFN